MYLGLKPRLVVLGHAARPRLRLGRGTWPRTKKPRFRPRYINSYFTVSYDESLLESVGIQFTDSEIYTVTPLMTTETDTETITPILDYVCRSDTGLQYTGRGPTVTRSAP
jgi:hypothetical protein